MLHALRALYRCGRRTRYVAYQPMFNTFGLNYSTFSTMSFGGFDPYGYSDGKWLRNDKANQEARRISFNFDALCQRVSPDTGSILTCEKLEGGFNRVFVFTLKNGEKIVAKLPFRNAGPRKLTTKSEVATIEFLKKHSSIPIPKIYQWSDDQVNEIGSEYIIMEYASGISLYEKWPSMKIDQRIECISNIYKALSSIDMHFPAYGSLYTNDYHIDSAIPLTEDKRFCVGPHVGTRYWDCSVGDRRYYHNVSPNRGPWINLSTWSDGLIDAGISRIPPHDDRYEYRPRYFGTPTMHLRLLENGRLLLGKILQDSRIRDSAVPMLFHPDLHKRNIWVDKDDPSKVTSIIDWQSASVEPAFWFTATTPDFVMSANHSTNTGIIAENGPQIEACAQADNVSREFYFPTLGSAGSLDASLLRPFQYGHRTWNDGAIAFQDDLITVLREWEDLGLEGPRPISIPEAMEIAVHDKNYRYFVAAQQLQKQVIDYLNVSLDGWVPIEAWESTKLQHQKLYENIVKHLASTTHADDDEPVKTENDLKAIWPFDLEFNMYRGDVKES